MDKNFGAKHGLKIEEPNSSSVSSSTDFEMPAPTEPATKRTADSLQDEEPPAKKSAASIRVDGGFKWNLQALAKAADAVGSGGKSPVSALNELGLKVLYSMTRQDGPAHCPNFTVSVTVANMSFSGSGHSKREARASAARACLAALLSRAGRVLPVPGPPPDFTSDEPSRYTAADFQCLEAKGVRPDSKPPAPPAPSLFGPLVATPVSKSPINTLYEQYPGLTFHCTFGDGSPLTSHQVPPQLSHSMRFKVVCQIKDQVFEGYGSSKKLAKLATARAALGELCERGQLEPQDCSAEALPQLPQLLADHVAKIVNEKFNELMKEDLVHIKRKVLAGIVITVENNIESAKVIAVATGTKCVSGEHISVRGQAVNDGHAEVVARRCLQRFLYSQLLMYANAEDPTKPIPESDLEPLAAGGYRLKEDRRVHLYVSTAPCGDGRIFSPHENYHAEPDKHPNRLARGQLRTKIESGEGTIPVKNSTNVLQTWDGLLQGERLLTMSCSDKVARWCVVGLQGALLGRLIRPVYLHSLVLGSLLHQTHMYRALCGRVEGHISSLPPPYQLQRPRLARAHSVEARTPARAPSFTMCWTHSAPGPEIINSTTGKLESGHPSLICKQSMFARWHYVVRRLPLLPQGEGGSLPRTEDLDQLLYSEAKQLCAPYQEAKNCIISAFDRAKLGKWIKKPIEQDHFQCEILNADPALLFAWAARPHGDNAMQIPRPPTGANTSCALTVGDKVTKKEIVSEQNHPNASTVDNKVTKKDIVIDQHHPNDRKVTDNYGICNEIYENALNNEAIATNTNHVVVKSEKIDCLTADSDRVFKTSNGNSIDKTNVNDGFDEGNNDFSTFNENASNNKYWKVKTSTINAVDSNNASTDALRPHYVSDKLNESIDNVAETIINCNKNNTMSNDRNVCNKIHGITPKSNDCDAVKTSTNKVVVDKNSRLIGEALRAFVNGAKIDDILTKNDKTFKDSKKIISKSDKNHAHDDKEEKLPKSDITCANKAIFRDCSNMYNINTLNVAFENFRIKPKNLNVQSKSDNEYENLNSKPLRRPKCVKESDYVNFDPFKCNLDNNSNSRINDNSNLGYCKVGDDKKSKVLQKFDKDNVQFKIEIPTCHREGRKRDSFKNFKPQISKISSRLKIAVGPLEIDPNENRLDFGNRLIDGNRPKRK